MEILYYPLTVLFVGLVGLSVLAAASSEIEFAKRPSVDLETCGDLEAFLGARLVARYMNSEQYSFNGLPEEMESYFGLRAAEKMLKAVNKTFDDVPKNKLPKLHSLHGFVLSELKRETEAAKAFKKALLLNPNDTEARKRLALYYTKSKMFGNAKTEIEAVLRGGAIKGHA